MGFLNSLTVYAGSWTVVGKEKLAEEDVKQIKSAEVVPSKFGLSLCFILHSGGKQYMPLSRDADLEEGDIVDVNSIEVLTLERDGDDAIWRATGKSL